MKAQAISAAGGASITRKPRRNVTDRTRLGRSAVSDSLARELGNANAREARRQALRAGEAHTPVEPRPAQAAPDSEYKGSRPMLSLLTSEQARGLTVRAMMGRESTLRGEFTTGEVFTVLRRDGRGWTVQTASGRVCTGVPSQCLQVLGGKE